MKALKKIVLLSTLNGILCISSFAQKQGQARIDSLLGILPNASEDTAKVILLNDLCFTYYSINPDEGLKYGDQALKLAEKLGWKQGVAQANGRIGANHFGKADYPKALEYWLKALEQNEKLKNKRLIGINLGNIGNVYLTQGDHPKALEYYSRACAINEEMGNKGALALNYGNIGTVYGSQSNNPKALDYFLKALTMYEELHDDGGIARTSISVANVYMTEKDYAAALDNNFKALEATRAMGIKNLTAVSLVNIGKIYFELAEGKNMDHLRKLFGGNKDAALRQAKAYDDSAIVVFKEIGDLDMLQQGYLALSEVQSLMGDNTNALQSYKNHTLFKDSVFNMEKNKKLTETAMQYAFDKKEAAAKADQEKKDIRQRNIRTSITGIAVFLLVLLLVFINRYRFKQKANKELAAAYENLKSTQQQLVKSEKMAAFGTMASRVAHEIQNPLNFVNNFSELSEELVEEIINASHDDERKQAGNVLTQNLKKIIHHGKRADDIVKQLQEHTRAGTAFEFFEKN